MPDYPAISQVILIFFQAEDGIRDYKVTGVQTCALPICGLGLLGLVANFQESGMFRRIRRSLFTKSFRPAIRNCGEVRISVAPELGDQFWERIGEIFVIANTEAIALHDDVAAKTACIAIKRGELSAFRRRENRSRNREIGRAHV